jgi:DNA-binding protein H-NS
MTALLTQWKALPLEDQHKLFPQITEVYEAAKDARRQILEAEIRAMGFKPGTGKAKAAKAKYRSKADASTTWGGTGQMAAWLKKEMQDTGLPVEAFRIA